VLAAVLLVVAAGGAYALARQGSSAAAAAAPRTVTATVTTMQQTVSSTGTLEPANEADLSFGAAGTVQTLDATVGEKVTKGERLATIDDAALTSQVQLAQAQVDQAQAQVTASASGTSAQVAAAQAQLASARARLSSAEDALSGATLTAPFSGVVASVNIQVGEKVTGSGSGSGGSGTSGSGDSSGSGASGGSATAAITVISTTSWVVTAPVTNADLPSLKEGLQAQIVPTGASSPVFGTVRSVGIVASSSSSGVAEFPVTIAVTGHPAGLYAGTSVSVSIIVKQLSNVLVVPTLAVRTQNDRTVVSVDRNGSVVTTPVTVGEVFGAQTQITHGLAEGDAVVLPTGGFQRGATGTTGGGTGTEGRGGAGFGGLGGFGGGFRGGFGARTGGTNGSAGSAGQGG
jgi:multidrug efflux pump subunit AcrA (membrane-fusion protein)